MRNIVIIVIVLLLIAGVFWFILNNKKNNPTTIEQDAMGELPITTINELQVTTVQNGSGPETKTGDTLSVHYIGLLQNGTKFDSSIDRGAPFEFTLGAGQVIKGWDQGLVSMRKGEKRNLIIPAHLAYGSVSPSPLIPAGSTLVFEVELLEIK